MGNTLKYRLGDIVTDGDFEFLVMSIEVLSVERNVIFYDIMGISGDMDGIRLYLTNRSPYWKTGSVLKEEKMPDCRNCKNWNRCHGMMNHRSDCWIASDEYIVNDTIQSMLAKLGENFEIDVAIEEMSELIKELLKYKRSKVLEREKQAASRDHVVEEIGDVMFMMEYLKQIFNITDEEIQKIVVEKAKRTKRRYIDGEK